MAENGLLYTFLGPEMFTAGQRVSLTIVCPGPSFYCANLNQSSGLKGETEKNLHPSVGGRGFLRGLGPGRGQGAWVEGGPGPSEPRMDLCLFARSFARSDGRTEIPPSVL